MNPDRNPARAARSIVGVAALCTAVALQAGTPQTPCAQSEPERDCDLVVVLADFVFDLTRLKVEIAYPATEASFDDGAGAVDCAVDQSQDDAVGTFLDSPGKLVILLERAKGLRFGVLVRCGVRAAEDVDESDFTLSVVEAVDSKGNALQPPPQVGIDAFDCQTSTTVPSSTSLPETTTTIVTTTTLLEPEPVCGDADGDGRITAADALVALRTAVGLAACEPARCDVNGDTAVNSSDALLVLRAAVSLPGSLSCP